ncbi:MAG: hypothetical protein ACRDMJ_18120, partial [Solirubrobacteraceae bacterium]
MSLVAISIAIATGSLAVLGISPIAGGSAPVAAAASTPQQQIGMRVLLITDSIDPSSASGIAYGDWVNTLNREGVPFDSVVTSSQALPALSSLASDGTEVANYQGVVVATSGTEGLSDAQWATLETFEQHFNVRQVTAYAVPSADFGLSAPSPSGGEAMSATTAATLTADGRSVFQYLNTVTLGSGTWGYEGTPLAGAAVDTLISGPGQSSLVGVFTSPDGRQTMYQTFNQNQYMLQSELLRHGELDWLARNTYFGDQRNYLETHIDDNFLSDDAWSIAGNASTAAHSTDYDPANALREVPADIITAANWSRDQGFRIDMLFNGGGSTAWAAGCTTATAGDGGGAGSTSTDCNATAPGTDPLLAQLQSTDPASGKPYTGDFGWISHTWDHANIDQGCATQNYIEAELNQNTSWAGASGASNGNPNTGGLGLATTVNPASPLGNDDPSVVVAGEHSGLPNLLPGNPGQVDPPSLDSATAAADAGRAFGTTGPAVGEYVYAVSDQFNVAAPGATPAAAAGAGESAASFSAPVSVAAGQAATLSWGAVCHAAGYIVYRAPYTAPVPPATAGTIGAWSQIGTVAATTSDFTDPTGTSTTDVSGGGPIQKAFTDAGLTGAAAPAGKPQTEGTAVESAYEQNPVLNAAFAATQSGGIKYFGADASKPYPNPADAAFATGAFTGAATQHAAGATFPDAGATAVPRYPTNIYYNVSTAAQEVDEYQTLYDLPTCV